MLIALRKKFILINMLLVFLILVIVFFFLCISNYQELQNKSYMILELAFTNRNGQEPTKFQIGKKPPEDYVREPVFLLRVNPIGEASLVYADNISVTEDELSDIVSEVTASGKNQGVLSKYNLRYLRKDEGGNTIIAFTDLSSENSAMRNIIVSSFLLVILGLIAFFTVSLFLSKWALRPVAQAWRQQRRFVADASHELKTPLTVILANTGILKSNRTDTIENQINWVNNTEAEAKRMKTLVDDLLFLAKCDDAKVPAVHNQLNLSDVALSISLAFESVAFEHGVSLDTDAISPNIGILGDIAQMRQLVEILLDNAVKYSEANGVVTLSLTTKQSKAVLAVHNEGIPVTPEDMEHLFERFFRADKSRSDGGYGLGLSIAKSIVDVHNGKISVESSQCNGTTFTVILPIKAA